MRAHSPSSKPDSDPPFGLNWIGRLRRWLTYPITRYDANGVGHADAALESLRYIVLDTEFATIGKRSRRLLSVGAIAMDGSKIRLNQQFYRVVNPGVPVSAPGVLIHKLLPGDIEHAESPKAVVEQLRAFVGPGVVVGHFVRIDLDILQNDSAEVGRALDNPAIDTARVHRWIMKRRGHGEGFFVQLENVDLQAVAETYRLESGHAHDALADAFLTARVWQRQLHLLNEAGIRTFGQLKRIGSA